MLLSFNVDTFNTAVGDFHDVRRYGDKHQDLNAMGPTIEKFGVLFRKYGKQDHLALSLAHRHFKLNEGERKVAKQDKFKSTIEIGPISGEDAQQQQVLPYLLMPMKKECGEVGLAPLEYVLPCDSGHRSRLEEELKSACDEAFLQEFVELALVSSMEGVYGLMVRSRDTLTVDKEKEAYLESTGSQPRSLKVEIVPKSEYEGRKDITMVAWVFEKCAGSKAVEAGSCWGYWCCSYCSH